MFIHMGRLSYPCDAFHQKIFNPEKPVNAMDSSDAAISAIGKPRKGLGILHSSIRSRIPENRTMANMNESPAVNP